MDEEKELEKLMDKIFDADQLETPPSNFTTSVIQKIETAQKEKFTYRPLLPKWVFVAIGIFIALFTWYGWNATGALNVNARYVESFSESINHLLVSLSNFGFSVALSYSILAFGLMLCLQGMFLNRKYHAT